VAFLDFAELAALMDEAAVVVSHAGVGSILCALRAGHVPVVVPRLARHGETVDDHQLELARRLQANGLVTLVADAAELRAALARDGEPAGGMDGTAWLGSDLGDYLARHLAA
jgi:UDP-N-acetylglucosamine transferase subunit ALG13